MYECVKVWGVCLTVAEEEVEGEPGDDERQGADPWGILLGRETSRVRGATSWGLEGWDGGFRERRG